MLSLVLKAELEGVTDLQPSDTEENPYFYTFKVQCSSCRETHPNWVSFNRFEQHEIPGSRGEANFVWKCRLCTKTHTASIVSGPNVYEADEKKAGKKIIEIDCRGLEFVDFQADVEYHGVPLIYVVILTLSQGEWEAKGAETSTRFKEIDLMEGEWYDYDEKAGEVSIKEITWTVGR